VSATKEARALRRALLDQGFTVTPTRGGHFRITKSDTTLLVFVPSTPSDPRALKNAVALLRRSGFSWRGR
jgi:predicted RNA binding protein YcfA (HicA-like mRNA interferase family)